MTSASRSRWSESREGHEITLDDVIDRFTARPAETAAARAAQEHVQGVVLSLAQEFVIRLPEGREQDRAIDRLEEAWMWADKAIARGL